VIAVSAIMTRYTKYKIIYYICFLLSNECDSDSFLQVLFLAIALKCNKYNISWTLHLPRKYCTLITETSYKTKTGSAYTATSSINFIIIYLHAQSYSVTHSQLVVRNQNFSV